MDPNYNHQNELSSSNQDPNRYDFINQYQPSTTVAQQKPPKKHKKLWLMVAISVLAVLVISGGIYYAVRHPHSKTLPSEIIDSTLTTEVLDGITIAYPQNWSAFDGESLGFSKSYTSNGAATTDGSSIYYRRSQIMVSPVLSSDFNDSAKKSIDTTSINGLRATMGKICPGFKLIAQAQFSTELYFGVDVSSNCPQSLTNRSTIERDRFLYIGDGYLYQVVVIAKTNIWHANEKLFDLLTLSVLPDNK